MPYCQEGWQNGDWLDRPNPACYCPEDAYKDMEVIPSVGKAFRLAEEAATPSARYAGVMSGVTRMMVGSIPSSWGRKADGSLAAWHEKLISV